MASDQKARKAKKKILYVVAHKDFKDDEFFIPKKSFERQGFDIDVCSDMKGTAIGVDGGKAEAGSSLKDAFVDSFDAVVIAGGKGAMDFLAGDDDLHRLLFDSMRQDKIIAAICISPLILARLGLLRGKMATVWTDETKAQADELKALGAFYFDDDVVIDRNIITANGPGAASEFADTIIDKLSGKY